MKELRLYLGCIPRIIDKDRITMVVKCSWEDNTPTIFNVTDNTMSNYLIDMSQVYGLSCYNNIDEIVIVHAEYNSAYVLKLFKYITENTKHTQVKVLDVSKAFEYTLGVE